MSDPFEFGDLHVQGSLVPLVVAIGTGRAEAGSKPDNLALGALGD